jgi:hypothetical protein
MTVSGTSRTRLFTAFGTVLYVEPTTGELRHGPVDQSPANAFFVADGNAGGALPRGRLAHETNGSLNPIVCHSDVCLLAPEAQRLNRSTDATSYDLIPLERGLLTLRSGGLFLSAIPDGRTILRAPVCSTWELLMASEDWCTAELQVDNSWRSDSSTFDRRKIEDYIVNPVIRARTGRRPQRQSRRSGPRLSALLRSDHRCPRRHFDIGRPVSRALRENRCALAP